MRPEFQRARTKFPTNDTHRERERERERTGAREVGTISTNYTRTVEATSSPCRAHSRQYFKALRFTHQHERLSAHTSVFVRANTELFHVIGWLLAAMTLMLLPCTSPKTQWKLFPQGTRRVTPVFEISNFETGFLFYFYEYCTVLSEVWNKSLLKAIRNIRGLETLRNFW